MVGVLGVISISTSNIDTSNDGSTQEIKNKVQLITVELEDISILQVSERVAIIEIKFKLDNPNSRSVIANLLTYSLFASKISNPSGLELVQLSKANYIWLEEENIE